MASRASALAETSGVADQAARDLHGQRALAHTLGAGEEQRRRQAAIGERPREQRPDAVVAEDRVERHQAFTTPRASAASRTRAATSSAEPSAFTKTQRAGSAFAITR
jgi:hypothetical protein